MNDKLVGWAGVHLELQLLAWPREGKISHRSVLAIHYLFATRHKNIGNVQSTPSKVLKIVVDLRGGERRV